MDPTGHIGFPDLGQSTVRWKSILIIPSLPWTVGWLWTNYHHYQQLRKRAGQPLFFVSFCSSWVVLGCTAAVVVVGKKASRRHWAAWRHVTGRKEKYIVRANKRWSVYFLLAFILLFDRHFSFVLVGEKKNCKSLANTRQPAIVEKEWRLGPAFLVTVLGRACKFVIASIV